MTDSRALEPRLTAQLEGLLFVAAHPVAATELAETLAMEVTAIEAGLRELESELEARGLRLQRHAGRIQLTTAPEMAATVERFLGLEVRTDLSRPALETLAIIAYEQPVTRPHIDSVRGVNSESMLKSLLFKGLIYEMGRSPGPGRPILYATTPELLQHLGLTSIAELPPVAQASPPESPADMLKD
jgi:segregation and condensation protein B